MSECPSEECQDKRYGSSIFDRVNFPSNIKATLEKGGLISEVFEQCNYCGTVWCEMEKPDTNMVFTTDSCEVGCRDVGSNKMKWHKNPIIRRR